jgi:hypothetical protein
MGELRSERVTYGCLARLARRPAEINPGKTAIAQRGMTCIDGEKRGAWGVPGQRGRRPRDSDVSRPEVC